MTRLKKKYDKRNTFSWRHLKNYSGFNGDSVIISRLLTMIGIVNFVDEHDD